MATNLWQAHFSFQSHYYEELDQKWVRLNLMELKDESDDDFVEECTCTS